MFEQLRKILRQVLHDGRLIYKRWLIIRLARQLAESSPGWADLRRACLETGVPFHQAIAMLLSLNVPLEKADALAAQAAERLRLQAKQKRRAPPAAPPTN